MTEFVDGSEFKLRSEDCVYLTVSDSRYTFVITKSDKYKIISRKTKIQAKRYFHLLHTARPRGDLGLFYKR